MSKYEQIGISIKGLGINTRTLIYRMNPYQND